MEMEDADETTPHPRNFHLNQGNLEVEPYETPVALKHRERLVIDLSDAETDASETLQIGGVHGDRKKDNKGRSERVTIAKVCCVVMHHNW